MTLKLSDFNPEFPTKVAVKKNINNKDVTFPVDALLKTHNNAIDQADCGLEVDIEFLTGYIKTSLNHKGYEIDVVQSKRLAKEIANNITKILKPVRKP